MSKAFPTKEELAKKYVWLAIVLTTVGAVLWGITYAYKFYFLYAVVCPLILVAAVGSSWLTLRNRNTVRSWLLLVYSLIFFIISLLPWFLPIVY